jgi:cytochrome b involved in lipid metabolism
VAAGKAVKPAYTWQEVAKHNTAASLWVTLDGVVYDLTEFVDRHPGGRDMLMLAAGREVTDLFRMYHVFNEERARKFLAPYAIGTFTGPYEFPQYRPEAPGGFYAKLKERVIAHFKTTGKDPKSPVPGLLRMIPTIALFLVTFLVLNDRLAPGLPFWFKLCVLAPVFGVLQVLPLMHWLHDSSHGSIGWNQWWWRSTGILTMDLLAGGSTLPWAHQHIIGHHVMTNVFQADPDLPVADKGDMRRLVPRQAWQALYKWQHVYLPVLYGLLGMKIRIQVRRRRGGGGWRGGGGDAHDSSATVEAPLTEQARARERGWSLCLHTPRLVARIHTRSPPPTHRTSPSTCSTA